MLHNAAHTRSAPAPACCPWLPCRSGGRRLPIAKQRALYWRCAACCSFSTLLSCCSSCRFALLCTHAGWPARRSGSVSGSGGRAERHACTRQLALPSAHHLPPTPNPACRPPQAYSPLAKAQKLADPTVAAIAQRLGVTPAQVLIRCAGLAGASVAAGCRQLTTTAGSF